MKTRIVQQAFVRSRVENFMSTSPHVLDCWCHVFARWYIVSVSGTVQSYVFLFDLVTQPSQYTLHNNKSLFVLCWINKQPICTLVVPPAIPDIPATSIDKSCTAPSFEPLVYTHSSSPSCKGSFTVLETPWCPCHQRTLQGDQPPYKGKTTVSSQPQMVRTREESKDFPFSFFFLTTCVFVFVCFASI